MINNLKAAISNVDMQVAGGAFQEGFEFIPAQFGASTQGRRLSQASPAPAPSALYPMTPLLQYMAAGSPIIYEAGITFQDSTNGTIRVQ